MYLAGCKHFGREVAVLGRFGAKVWQETVPNDLQTGITTTMKCGLLKEHGLKTHLSNRYNISVSK